MANLVGTSLGSISATTLSGSGASLTGLNASNITAGSAISRTNMWSKGFIFYSVATYSTRSVLGANSDSDFWTFNFTKQQAGSIIIIDGFAPQTTQINGGQYQYFKMDGTKYYDCCNDCTTGNSGQGFTRYYRSFSGLGTGTHNCGVGWNANGGGNQPFGLICPNNNDNGNWNQAYAVIHVWEMQA
jgi:hypothetical protein